MQESELQIARKVFIKDCKINERTSYYSRGTYMQGRFFPFINMFAANVGVQFCIGFNNFSTFFSRQ